MTTAIHYYVFINAFFSFTLGIIIYFMILLSPESQKNFFFRCYVFPQTLMIQIIPVSSNFKKLFAELFPNLNFIWSRYVPWRAVERAYDTAVKTNSSEWQSVFAVSCFQRKRGWVICPLRYNGEQDWHNFRFRRDREIPLWLECNNE